MGYGVTKIYRNPTEALVTSVLKDSAYMRVLHERESGDFIVWPGEKGFHADIMKELNLTEDTADNLGTIRSFADMEKLVDWVTLSGRAASLELTP